MNAVKTRERSTASRRRDQIELASFVSEVGIALSRKGSMEETLERCARAVVNHLDAAFVRIWALGGASGPESVAMIGTGETPVFKGTEDAPCHAKISRMLRDQQPLLTNDIRSDPEISHQDWIQREGLRSFAGHPLVIDEQIVGALVMFGKKPLCDDAIVALALVSTQLALGVERKRSEHARLATEARTRFALEAAGVGVWEHDLGTGSAVWSPTLREMAGIPADAEASIEYFLGLIHPEDRPAFERESRNALAFGADFVLEFRIAGTNDKPRWILSKGRPVGDGSGRPRLFVGVSTDVTDRKLLEAEYLQAQKMEAVGQLAGGIAHDFNNQLTAIIGCAQFIKSRLLPLDPLRLDAEEIEQVAQCAVNLTRQLLAFSRKQVLQPQRVDLNSVILEVSGMLQRVIGENVRLKTELEPGVAAVWADPGQIQQVLLNLVVNARDAMPAGGEVRITTSDRVAGSGEGARIPSGHWVVLSVIDTGFGMDDAVKARLFEPFFTTKETGKGTGLGLATVFGIVQQSGGHIRVESELGQGAAFHVFLPAGRGPASRGR